MRLRRVEMRAVRFVRMVLSNRLRPPLAVPSVLTGRPGDHRCLGLVCIVITTILTGGCSHFNESAQVKSAFAEAARLDSQGSYQAALDSYVQIVGNYPAAGDRALFEMGVIYAHPKNALKDYEKALACFHRLITDYPASGFRHDSEMMIFYIDNGLSKDKTIDALRTQIGALQAELDNKAQEILARQGQIETLEQKVFAFASLAPVDKILVEKRARQLKLVSRGEVIKTYRIALGGNPEGPKERQGDHKTPEGTYFIDAKNRDSAYHLSLHISYPNERDRQRAEELGAPPGGDIMIHGIKNGFAWVGNAHAEVDWTQGCIAVTDQEIEEIDKLAPIGTPVEIMP